ncbi:MAG TPA: hypothetical protein VK524_19510 [Polyangiaceae bacterium]|nr:hypothetical protein [Polyangiaceae bacterium]
MAVSLPDFDHFSWNVEQRERYRAAWSFLALAAGSDGTADLTGTSENLKNLMSFFWKFRACALPSF